MGRTNVDLELVRRDLAWHYTRYSSDPQLAAAERSARAARLGLWADAHPIPLGTGVAAPRRADTGLVARSGLLRAPSRRPLCFEPPARRAGLG
jgi:endonuclease YncB( thermonuclease family)